MAQAPNRYPEWLAPKAPVTLEFSGRILKAFTNEFIEISSPKARIRYFVVEPAAYNFHWTNTIEARSREMTFSFSGQVDRLKSRTNIWTGNPRGTVFLLHGYGVAGFAMLPWSLYLAENGWRCVVVDLRGHGKSTGKRIYFGTQEVFDMRCLMDELQRQGRIAAPVCAVGDSFGAVVSLRWKALDPRIEQVVAISPYANLGDAISNIARQYARWFPQSLIKAGIAKLPDLLEVDRCELDPECWIARAREEQAGLINGNGSQPPDVSTPRLTTPIFFVAGGEDRIAPVEEVEKFFNRAPDGSRMLVVPNATHEMLPFAFDELTRPILEWLPQKCQAKHSPPSKTNPLAGLD